MNNEEVPPQQVMRNYLSKETEHLLVATHHHEQMKLNQHSLIHPEII